MIKKLLNILILFFVLTISIFADLGTNDIFTIKCGTFIPNNSKIVLDKQLAKISDDERPILQKEQSSGSGRFLVHYDISGKNAVNSEDADNNGVPDFIDSVCFYYEYVYNMEVNQLHYREPATDGGRGGSDAFDVYVLNIGQGTPNNPGLYGYTVPEIELPGGLPSRQRYSSYIVIDNDFSQRDSSYTDTGKKYATFRDTSFLGLKITIAHEYHHAIQFMYGEDATAPSINEMTSTWFEYRIFPETNDYMQYVEYLFEHPESYTFGNGNPITGYLYSIFGQYAYRYYGDSLFLRMWEIIATGVQSYAALDDALKEKNTNLASAWCDFMNWLYYTGERAKKDYGFDHAVEFPLIKFFKDVNFSTPAYTNSGNLLSYAFRFFRLTLQNFDISKSPNIFDLVITNTDIKSAIFQSEHTKSYLLTVTDESRQGYELIGNTGFYYHIAQPEGDICHQSYIKEGDITQSICYAYPNPFLINSDESIFFPAPHDALFGSDVHLILMNDELLKVYEGNLQVVANNDKRVVELPRSYLINIGSGIFIFKVSDDISECSGKIAIIND